ncbi:MAG: MTH938/NDUFAF3 family protein [Candidatus Thermoplasmatota archaeon]
MKKIMIENYSFGKMSVNGKKYSSDLIIFPSEVKDNWRRKKGHRLLKEDVEEIVEKKPDLLVIGTGAYGFMKIPKRTLEYLESSDIEVIYDKTKKAVEIFNEKIEEEKEGKIVAAFHLTC